MKRMPHIFPTVVHMLAAATENYGDACALVHEDRHLNYSEYVSCVAGLALRLREYAGGNSLRGERVAIICGNSLEMAVGTFAVHAAGAQVVPINPIYTKRELTHILSDAAPLAVIYDANITPTVKPILDAQGISNTIRVGGADGAQFDIWRAEDIELPGMPTPDDLATLQYTGGTTGLPKGVDITHRQLSINISQREAAWPFQEGTERILCAMPLFHVFASSMALHCAVYCKGQLNILTKYRPDLVLATIEQESITALPVGPTIFHGLMAYEGFDQTDFSSLRAAYSGSAPLPDDTLKRWETATGCRILEGYGQSEGGPVVALNHADTKAIPGSVGRPLIDTQVQIVDVETGLKVLAPSEQGEIRIRGPQIMSGYRNRPEETAIALRDGWLYTGDIGELDAVGNLYIRDRKKDMALVGGYNVYPREIDEVLYAHPDIAEAAAVGVPDDYRGEIIKACVVLRPDTGASADELLDYCRENLAKYKVPAAIDIVEELPKTTVGKIDKLALRDLVKAS